MNKKEYQVPSMKAVKIQYTKMLMTSDIFTTTSTNLLDDEAIIFGGGGDGTGIFEPR